MKKYALIGFFLLMMLGSGCSGEEEANTDTSSAEETTQDDQQPAEVDSEEPENAAEDDEQQKEKDQQEYAETDPLTGKGTNEVSPYRPMAVMINNHPKARPQTGINKADIVYEVLTEGETTRFLALYQSEQPERMGPVRSARGYFIDLAAGYNALYVSHGWSPEAKQMLHSGAAPFLNGLFYDGTLFQRSSDRQAPHNSYITFDDAIDGLTDKGYEVKQDTVPLLFEEDGYSSSSAVSAENVSIWYRDDYVVQFSYDEDKEQYARSSDNVSTTDAATGEQTNVKNVMIVEAPHQVVDDKGRRQINLNNGGDGLLLSNGEALKVQWQNKDGRLLPFKDGRQVPFAPGRTWINVIPSSSGIEGSVEGINF